MMTKVQLNRLQKLHDFVKSNVPPKQFDMKDFRLMPDDSYYDRCDVNAYSLKDMSCGSVGCLMGWTPFALKSTMNKLKLIPKDRYDSVNWDQASTELFGIGGSDPRWNYLFESDWSYQGDNKFQKKAALKRIRKLIASGGKLTEEMKNEMDDANVYYDLSEYENSQC